MGRIHGRIMAPVREARSNAARVGGTTHARQIAGIRWLYDKQRGRSATPWAWGRYPILPCIDRSITLFLNPLFYFQGN